MAEPVTRRDPREIRREALRKASDYYDLSREELDDILKGADAVLVEQINTAQQTLGRDESRLERARLADERLLIEKIRDAWLDFHRPDDAGPNQVVSLGTGEEP